MLQQSLYSIRLLIQPGKCKQSSKGTQSLTEDPLELPEVGLPGPVALARDVEFAKTELVAITTLVVALTALGSAVNPHPLAAALTELP